MHDVLATNSHLIFVWHDNAGQSFPENSPLFNTTVSTNGFRIDIKDEAVIAEPLILLTSSGNENHARNIINIGKNAKVQVIEYILCDDLDGNNNIVTDIECSPGSDLKHCILHQAKNSASITQQSITTIKQNANSRVTSNIFSFGSNLSSIELAIALQGENASCNTSCLAYTNDSEVQNVLLKIDHMVPRCNSNCVARGVLKDKSNTDFIGRIVVHKDAQKSYADLQIKNLLCSPKAQAINRPELEIYNDDVHCSHGSSTGQMNEEALFYMRSRGLDEQQAIAMIIDGFIQPAIESCTISEVANFVKGIIKDRA